MFDSESVWLLMEVTAAGPAEAETLASLRASRIVSRFDKFIEVVLATVIDP